MALQKLREYFNETNINHFNDMMKNRVLVTEKISAPSFHVRKTFDKFQYFKSGDSEPMNMVDRTITTLYEVAIKHFQSLSTDIKNQMPLDWKFGFEYLPETGVSEYKYDNVPYNNLILTHIQQLGEKDKVKKVITDPVILQKWSKILEVQAPIVIFDGILNELQKKQLVELLQMNDMDFSKTFDYIEETADKGSFTKKVYNIFNTAIAKSALNESLEKEIDGLIVSFVESNKIKSFKLEDFIRESINENRESSHMYQITIADLLEYFTTYELDKIQLTEESADYRYIELISAVYNDYLKTNSYKFVGVNFDSADFSTVSSFKLNTKYLKNETTLRYVSNNILAELFKITLGSFRKKRNKTSDIINQDMLNKLNEIVDKINELVFVENADKNAIYDFNNFMLHNKIKVGVDLNEALKVNHTEQGKELVNMFVGRFQPFTLGHAKVLETINKQNGHPVVVFLVKAKTVKKEDAFSRPYDEKTQIEMFKKVQKQYPFLKEIYVIPSAAIDTMFNEMRPKYEPVLWGTGTDRLKVYGYQVNNDSYREQLNVRKDFELYEIPRDDNAISATKVRNAMLEGDEKAFKSMVPKALFPMYDELKSKLEVSMGVVAESINNIDVLTFKEFINKQ